MSEQKLTVYHYSKCSTCKNAIKWLTQQGHELDLIPIVEQPPSAEEVTTLIARSGLDSKAFFNTSGNVYKQENLKEKVPQLNERERAELLAGNGMLIKRPIVTDGQKATVGFREEAFTANWSR